MGSAAVTLAACAIKMSATASVESLSHLFVFHLVVHFDISIVFKHETPRGEKKNQKKSLLSTNPHKMCVYDSAMSEEYGDAQPEPGALRIRSPLSPTLTLMVEGILRRRRGGIARHSAPRELRAVRRLDKRPDAEPEPSIRH